MEVKTPPKCHEVEGEKQQASRLKIAQTYPAPHPDVDGDDDSGEDRDGHIGVGLFDRFEVVQEDRHTPHPADHVESNDEKVVTKQRKAASEIARAQVEYPINK